jgi:hypothetical protein
MRFMHRNGLLISRSSQLGYPYCGLWIAGGEAMNDKARHELLMIVRKYSK